MRQANYEDDVLLDRGYTAGDHKKSPDTTCETSCTDVVLLRTMRQRIHVLFDTPMALTGQRSN